MLSLVLYVPSLRALFRFAVLHGDDPRVPGRGGVGVLWFEGLKVIRRRRASEYLDSPRRCALLTGDSAEVSLEHRFGSLSLIMELNRHARAAGRDRDPPPGLCTVTATWSPSWGDARARAEPVLREERRQVAQTFEPGLAVDRTGLLAHRSLADVADRGDLLVAEALQAGRQGDLLLRPLESCHSRADEVEDQADRPRNKVARLLLASAARPPGLRRAAARGRAPVHVTTLRASESSRTDPSRPATGEGVLSFLERGTARDRAAGDLEVVTASRARLPRRMSTPWPQLVKAAAHPGRRGVGVPDRCARVSAAHSSRCGGAFAVELLA